MSAASIAILEGNELAIRHLRSESFTTLYRTVMALVEDLAHYLDVEGRQQSKSLSREAARDYAALSRQLTAGALRVASALLTLRAVKNGEMTFTSAMADIKKKEMTESPGGFTGSLDGLPQELLELATRCDSLRLEVVRLVDHLGSDGRSGANPVHAALGLINSAFGNA
jgi:regulator of CtrA degradation